MKYIKISFLLVCSLFLINCTDDEPNLQESSEVYLTLNIDPNHFALGNYGGIIEKWIFIHDENDKLIDYRQINNGDRIALETSKNNLSDNLTITLFTYTTYTNIVNVYHFHDFKTFATIKKGSILELTSNLREGTGKMLTGNFNLKITNVPTENFIGFNLSSVNSKFLGNDWSYTYENNVRILKFENASIYDGKNDFILSMLNKNGELKYIKLNNIENNADIIFDYNNALDFDQTIDVDIPENHTSTLFVEALPDDLHETDSGYLLYENFFGENKNENYESHKIGFLDEFEDYRIRLTVRSPDLGYRYTFQKSGIPPASINYIEKPTFNVVNESLSNFQFETPVDFIQRSSTWNSPHKFDPDTFTSELTSWIVGSTAKENPSLTEIPEEFILKYPAMDIESLQYQYTSLSVKSEPIIEENPIMDLFNESLKPKTTYSRENIIFFKQ